MKGEEYATKSVNGLGQVRWQPRDPGRGELMRSVLGGWTWLGMGWPVYYRSRSQAVRIGKREERRRLKRSWKQER